MESPAFGHSSRRNIETSHSFPPKSTQILYASPSPLLLNSTLPPRSRHALSSGRYSVTFPPGGVGSGVISTPHASFGGSPSGLPWRTHAPFSQIQLSPPEKKRIPSTATSMMP